jgi:hypothetical protein
MSAPSGAAGTLAAYVLAHSVNYGEDRPDVLEAVALMLRQRAKELRTERIERMEADDS